MGALFSSSKSTTGVGMSFENQQYETCKRKKLSPCFNGESARLIPSLPDEISYQILARLPRIDYLNMKLVSDAWKAAILSTELFKVRKELGTTEEWLYILTKGDGERLSWYALDPLSARWQKLPPMPKIAFEDESRKGLTSIRMWDVVGSGTKIADVVRGWLGKKDSLNYLPFCGCAIGSVDGCLYVVGGFSRASVLKSVWRFNPILYSWTEVSPMSMGRAYCKTAVLNNKLYIVGGVTRGQGGLTPLQSAEVFDPCAGEWSMIPTMSFAKAQILPTTAFLADLLKPIATGMTAYKGRLFVAQSLYCWPFFVDVGGEVFDPEDNSWVDMPIGMGEGWPARQAGTKLSLIVEGELYALDPSGSPGSARIKVYDYQEDDWRVVVADVPIADFSSTKAPYLLAGLNGKLQVITKDGNNIMVLETDVRQHCTALSSSDSLPNFSNPIAADLAVETWTVVASRCFGCAELVSCQTLSI